MQTGWPFKSTASSTGQHASTCSITRLNPLVQTRHKTRYNVPPAVCSTTTGENHDFSLFKRVKLAHDNESWPWNIARNSKFNSRWRRWRSTWRRYTFQTRVLRLVSTFSSVHTMLQSGSPVTLDTPKRGTKYADRVVIVVTSLNVDILERTLFE